MAQAILDDPSALLLLILFGVAFFAGTIDAIAGGGGLIVMPVLLLAGVPPLQALGTNKFQGLFGTGSASFTFFRKGYIDLKRDWLVALGCFSASVAGAMVASLIPSDWLALAMPVVLIGIALYFALKPDLDHMNRIAKVTPLVMGAVIIPLTGFYDGVFGPGTGSLMMLALVAFGGLSVLQATARTKLFNFASNLGGFLGFAVLGAVLWKIGLVMALGQIIGGTLGAQLAARLGARLIRPLLVTICILMALKLVVG